MSSAAVDKIARAVLYEGYLLYPYRPSALKNQQRWNFGVLYPPAWAGKQAGSDRSYFQMECVASDSATASVDVSVRFLQLVARHAGNSTSQEAIEQIISVPSLALSDLVLHSHVHNVSLAGGDEPDDAIVRRRFPLEGQIEVSASPVHQHAFRLALQFRNITRCAAETREDALMHSFASAHAVVHIREGEFASSTDPPKELSDAVARCQNTGVWPVLVGETGSRDTMLASPIILYDYPQIAPESKGDLFDATEIDEILTLRILTLTEQEKRELRQSDERVRNILERLENSPPEHLLELHGTLRGVQQVRDQVCGIKLKAGDRVRLRPGKRADILDVLLEGKIAIIEAVEQDFEGNIHFAVVLEEDPGRDLGEMRQAGHRFFFSAEEVESMHTITGESR